MFHVDRTGLILLVGLVWYAAATAQQPPFVGRAELVQVDVAALDSNRQPILDLTQDDFTILEDGRPRPIVAFTRVDLPSNAGDHAEPAGLAAPAGAADDDATGPPLWPDEGRLIVILFDRSIPVHAGPAARTIASTVVDALGPTDLAAIVRTSPFAGDGLSQELTADRALLRRAIDSAYIGGTAPPSMGPGGLQEGRPDQWGGDCWCGICVLDGIRGVAEAIRDVQRLRKVVVFIGSDMASPGWAGRECFRRVDDARSLLLRQLDAANITVHAFDPLGLTTDAVPAGGLRGFDAAARREYGIQRRAALSDLPQHTGGRTVVNTNAPETEIRTALDESRTYYLLGFQPASAEPDGRYHRIDVKVKRRVATLRWRKGYYATR
jgi:VWFA-related protein